MKRSFHETVWKVISFYFSLQFAICRKWRVSDTWHDSNMWLRSLCAAVFWVHFNIRKPQPSWTCRRARKASTRLTERSSVRVVSPRWGVNVVTAPSQHAAAVVWWGRCSPFKLCLSPAVGHSLCYLHFWVTVLVSGISDYKMEKCTHINHMHSHFFSLSFLKLSDNILYVMPTLVLLYQEILLKLKCIFTEPPWTNKPWQ